MLQKTIEGRTYTVHGANADLIKWASRSALADAAFTQAKVDHNLLWKALGSDAYEVCVQHAKTIIERLWNQHPALGPYPFLDTLSDFEFDRYFYKDYRDHVCHQLKVYLLGLFAYDNCPLLRDAIDDKAADSGDPRSEFLVKWLVTAVYHDIGYVLENDHTIDRNQKAWIKTRDRLNEVHAAPLSALPMFAHDLSPEVERIVVNRSQIFTHSIRHVPELETHNTVDLFDQLREEAYLADLGPRDLSRSPVRSYYEYAFSHAPAKGGERGRFRDHGVASALLLLNTWRAFEAYVNRIIERAGSDPFIKPHFSKINALAEQLPARGGLVRAAAAAMALHNVEGKIWDIGDTALAGLTLNNFRIHLTTPAKQSPMAFLLRLVDTLQDWDRPRFRPLKPGERPPLDDQDISITAAGGKLLVHLPADKEFTDPATNPKSQYTKARATLLESLQQDAVEQLVGWTDTPVDMTIDPTPPLAPPSPPSAPDARGSPVPVINVIAASVAAINADPPTVIADKLYSSYQAHGKTKLFLLGTEYLRLATRRIALVAKTPIPIVGTRPYDGSSEPAHYERDQHEVYMQVITAAAAGGDLEVRCVGSAPAMRRDLAQVASLDFRQRILANMEHLRGLAGQPSSKFHFGWMPEDLPMTFVVADDRLIFWWKDAAGENVCLSTESALLAQSLYDSAGELLRTAADFVDLEVA